MRRHIRWTLALLAVAWVVLMALWLALSAQGAQLRQEAVSRTPQELIRYTLRRLEGHPKLEWALHPALLAAQRQFEREPPANLPALGKGQQTVPFPPIGVVAREIAADTPQAIREALLNAAPGTRITIAPGLYPFSSTLKLRHAGQAGLPIVLTARKPGTVLLEFTQLEGILVDQPHWVFENLNIQGVCKRHDDCEHAFHVVGRGEFTTIRNNHISDFDAHIKVNGSQAHWPDHGLIAHNTLTNMAPRVTLKPVALLDLVGANHWRVEDNLVNRFANRDGNRVAFGMYMKGASEGGRFERNLIVCSPEDVSAPGIRVGLSFGGGNTGQAYCRGASCSAYEHRNGSAINNIVAHCNDSGMDVNHSVSIRLLHNTLINTAGISTRRAPARAELQGNLLDGRALARDGTTLIQDQVSPLSAQQSLVAADRLQVEPNTAVMQPLQRSSLVTNDFFGRPRADQTPWGAVEAHPR